MPLPNFHACRLEDPDKYIRIRPGDDRKAENGKTYRVLYGFLRGGGSEQQAFRYPRDTWTAAEARAHCLEHDGTFEAATQSYTDPDENPMIKTEEP